MHSHADVFGYIPDEMNHFYKIKVNMIFMIYPIKLDLKSREKNDTKNKTIVYW